MKTANLTLPSMLHRVEEFEVSLTAYYRFQGYSGTTEHEWEVKLEKSKPGELDLRAQGRGFSFEEALCVASVRFFSAVDSKIDFTPALPTPAYDEDESVRATASDDEIPF